MVWMTVYLSPILRRHIYLMLASASKEGLHFVSMGLTKEVVPAPARPYSSLQ